MKFSATIPWTISALLLVVVLGMGYVFLVRGTVTPHADGRIAVLMSPNERNGVLGEMRGLLETVQGITAAAVDGDMAEVQALASAAGMAAPDREDPGLLRKLPLEFKTLGLATHRSFDELATLASVTDDPLAVLGEMAGVMNNCVACHNAYRIGIEGENTGE